MQRIAECEGCQYRHKENPLGCEAVGCGDCSFFGGYIKDTGKVMICGQLVTKDRGYCNKHNVEIYGLTPCDEFKCGVKHVL